MVEEQPKQESVPESVDLRALIRESIVEVMREQRESAVQEQVFAERSQREELEQKLNQLIEENRRNRAKAEEAERHTAIRAELERLGVAKVDLAFRAVKDDVVRDADGQLRAGGSGGNEDLSTYLKKFLDANPELLPPRMTGGSGQVHGSRAERDSSRIDLDRIQPGMNAEELERVRQEIVRVANQAFRGM